MVESFIITLIMCHITLEKENETWKGDIPANHDCMYVEPL